MSLWHKSEVWVIGPPSCFMPEVWLRHLNKLVLANTQHLDETNSNHEMQRPHTQAMHPLPGVLYLAYALCTAEECDFGQSHRQGLYNLAWILGWSIYIGLGRYWVCRHIVMCLIDCGFCKVDMNLSPFHVARFALPRLLFLLSETNLQTGHPWSFTWILLAAFQTVRVVKEVLGYIGHPCCVL